MSIRKILNRLYWNSRSKLENYELLFLHRGASDNMKRISCTQITSIKQSWFTYASEQGEVTTIPFHRILEIRNIRTGKPVWKKPDT